MPPKKSKKVQEMKLDNFKRQHAEIGALVDRLLSVSERDVEEEALAVAKDLNLLAGKIKIHLREEDRLLYPALKDHKNPDLAAVHDDYMGEMAGIADVFEAYKLQFNTATKLNADPERFVSETERVLGTLSERIAREDRDLYPRLT